MHSPVYPVVFTPEALQQLEELYAYIAQVASPMVALRYTNAIVTYCETLQTFPLRGTRRDDKRVDLRPCDPVEVPLASVIFIVPVEDGWGL